MSAVQHVAEQYAKLPVLVSPETCSGKVYIVTGANIGLGLETARHLVRCSAARVILAVRNVPAGEKAKADIERSTGRSGVAEVWRLDLASFASVQAFAKKASTELERVDALVENAGVMLDQWQLSEGMETCLIVNVISTLLLASLMMPKLMETAQKFGIQPRLVLVISTLGFFVKKELDKSGTVDMLDGLNDPKRANMHDRYAVTKLVEMYAVREFAKQFPVERTGVIINMIQPGLCSTSLARDTRSWIRSYIAVARGMMARTAEEGSRTILYGIVAGPESHGKLLSSCKIKDHWLPTWMTNEAGQHVQKQLWKEIAAKLEGAQPGCTSQLS